MTLRTRPPLLNRQRGVVRKENFGTRKIVSFLRSPRRSSKLWQYALLLPLLLFLSSVLQLKHLPVGMLVPSLRVTSATIITSLPAHVERYFVTVVAQRVTLQKLVRHKPNQPIKLPERESVRPATIAAKSGISSKTAPRQQQLATLEGF